MDSKQVALRILAHLYPDATPSAVRAVIKEAMEKEVNEDDISLWDALISQTKDEKKEEPKVIERHYYHSDYWRYPWERYTYYTNTTPSITCTSANDCLTGTTATTTYSAVNNC